MPAFDANDPKSLNEIGHGVGTRFIPQFFIWFNATSNVRENNERFMKNLLIIMTDRGKTRDDLVKITGLSEFYIDNVLAGRGRCQDVCRVCHKLGIGIANMFMSDDILKEQDEMKHLAMAS